MWPRVVEPFPIWVTLVTVCSTEFHLCPYDWLWLESLEATMRKRSPYCCQHCCCHRCFRQKLYVNVFFLQQEYSDVISMCSVAINRIKVFIQLLSDLHQLPLSCAALQKHPCKWWFMDFKSSSLGWPLGNLFTELTGKSTLVLSERYLSDILASPLQQRATLGF